MSWMNLTEYARHRGCYPRAVEQAIATGRIQRDARGLIDSEQADKDWESGTSPYRSAAAKANGAAGQAIRRKLAGSADATQAVRKLPASETTSGSGVSDISVYAKSRAEREHYQAQLAKLAYEERQKLLIDRSEVERTAEAFYARLQSAVLAIPDRIAAELASETDIQQVRQMLYDELSKVLTRTAKGAVMEAENAAS